MKEKNRRKAELKERLEDIKNILSQREGAEVYGSPEIIEEYGRETQRLRREADSLRVELEKMENE